MLYYIMEVINKKDIYFNAININNNSKINKNFLKANGLKRKVISKKEIRTKTIVLLIIGLLLSFYSVLGASVFLNEYGIATAYFESSTIDISQQNFAYFYFAWWSSSHGNACQSMINAIYASGLSFIINGVLYLIGKVVGHQVLSGTSAINFVAGFLVALYFNMSSKAALVDAEEDAAAAGASAEDIVAMTASASVLGPTIAGFLLGYLGILGAE